MLNSGRVEGLKEPTIAGTFHTSRNAVELLVLGGRGEVGSDDSYPLTVSTDGDGDGADVAVVGAQCSLKEGGQFLDFRCRRRLQPHVPAQIRHRIGGCGKCASHPPNGFREPLVVDPIAAGEPGVTVSKQSDGQARFPAYPNAGLAPLGRQLDLFKTLEIGVGQIVGTIRDL